MSTRSKPEQPAFIDRQYQFTAHVRDPDHNPRPEAIEERRMGVYRELLFNNIKGFIDSAFPVLHKIYGDTQWRALIRHFMAQHRASTPYFLEIPEEFLNFLNERGLLEQDPPFLHELAHYEWVELALSIAEDEPGASLTDAHDLLETPLFVSPVAWLLEYAFPVHRISADFQPEEPTAQPTYIVVYRDREDDIGFLEVNPVTARLISLVDTEPGTTGRAALAQIAEELSHPHPERVTEGGTDILRQLAERDIITGPAPTPS